MFGKFYREIVKKFPINVKVRQRVMVTLSIGLGITMAVGIWEYKTAHNPITTLERGGYNGAEYQEELTAKKEDGEEIDVTIRIPEQEYTPAEIKDMFEEIAKQLETDILGNNQSFNKIQQDLHLPSQLATWPAQISWSSNRPDVINWEGTIGERVRAVGEGVTITAKISYRDESISEKWELVVFPRILSEAEAQKQEIVAAIEASNSDKSIKTYTLPDEIDGEKILWFSLQRSTSAVVLIVTIILTIGFILGNRQEEIKAEQARKMQMQIDYPEILSKLMLLLNAGMSMRMSFAKVALDYRKQKEIHRRKKYHRYAYEEFLTTYYEMERGVLEVEAYERLGSRCGIAIYKIFSVLLIQNLQKGNQKLLESMEREMTNAFEERKRKAKILGEQAGTKMLLPMMIMLVIVLVLLLIPAFLSF